MNPVLQVLARFSIDRLFAGREKALQAFFVTLAGYVSQLDMTEPNRYLAIGLIGVLQIYFTGQSEVKNATLPSAAPRPLPRPRVRGKS